MCCNGFARRACEIPRRSLGDVLGYLTGGMSEEQILREFPSLTREDVRACLAFAADQE